MGTTRAVAVSRLGAFLAFLFVSSACSGSTEPPDLANLATSLPSPVVTASPGPTPLAVEPTGTAPTAKVTPRPSLKTTGGNSFYRPPGWDGHSDVDCPDFDTHAHAQSFFIGTGGSKTNDPYRLDSNHDGVACESLP